MRPSEIIRQQEVSEKMNYLRVLLRKLGIDPHKDIDTKALLKRLEHIERHGKFIVLKRHISGLYFLQVEMNSKFVPLFPEGDGFRKLERKLFAPYRQSGSTMYYIDDYEVHTRIKGAILKLGIYVPFRTDNAVSPIV